MYRSKLSILDCCFTVVKKKKRRKILFSSNDKSPYFWQNKIPCPCYKWNNVTGNLSVCSYTERALQRTEYCSVFVASTTGSNECKLTFHLHRQFTQKAISLQWVRDKTHRKQIVTTDHWIWSSTVHSNFFRPYFREK